jgi:signal transduction histidine kinase
MIARFDRIATSAVGRTEKYDSHHFYRPPLMRRIWNPPMERSKHIGFLGMTILTSIASIAVVAAEPRQGSQTEKEKQIEIGEHVVPLYGPWRFQVGDSPVDPVKNVPLWAEPGFDDSSWETVNLEPTNATQNAGDESELLTGWTARGHARYCGFAWYRIRLNFTSRAEMALAGPVVVDDAYQVFVGGKLLGSFGDFTRKRPVSYYSQPVLFPFSASEDNSGSTSWVIAFRVWMDPNTLLTEGAAGGFRSAPGIGEMNAVEVDYLRRWQSLIRSYAIFVIDALLFTLLAIGSFSLILFDRSDRVYLWIGIASILTAICSVLSAFDVWSQHLSVLADSLIVQCLLGPIAYMAWFMVWWVWFGRHKQRWMPIAASGLTLIHMFVIMIAIDLIPFPIPHPVAVTFEIVSLLARLLFFALLSWIVIEGIRSHGPESWLVLPAVALLSIGAFENELSLLLVLPSWFIFGARFPPLLTANLVLAALVTLLLLRRLLFSLRRQRLIELDAKRAQIQSDFVAAVSHEFRSPLTTLRAITDLLVEARIEDESSRRESYSHLDRETMRLQRLVEDLLDFGRMESGLKQYRISICDAFQLVRAAVTDLSEQAQAEGFCIETNLVANPAVVRADQEALRRAIRNLLENAMKYSPKCRTVWVDGVINNEHVSIAVRDRGMGIDVSEQRSIFQKFVRGDAAKKAGIKGTGIGLAMVQQISEAMGGKIQLQSEVGVGSTFTILLPLVEQQSYNGTYL